MNVITYGVEMRYRRLNIYELLCENLKNNAGGISQILVTKKSNAKEILNLVAILNEIVVIPLVAFYIAIWNQLCCCLGEFVMLNGVVKLSLIGLYKLE